MVDLAKLALLIKEKNIVDNQIASIIGRPAQVGHAGEYIASAIFGIRLHASATQKGSDGHFVSSSLAGHTVNIKWYPKRENLLDLNLNHFPDYYLVLTGPKSPAISSRGAIRPWLIEYVYFFETQRLHQALKLRNVKIGVATSVIEQTWFENEIFPVQRNQTLLLTEEQRHQLALFK
ncbi:hypothetical protein [Ktedonospora formicarum]|uniref:Uncharacterized protein n=1 Tax=Ktedonospora formicarum TaxID=2778364 RepID=A0A8J3I518_9CHLR|nr:hypothetical protein [Ktedonospora formicarum]GHO49634.1 hypothetical protein KSX_77970 [Ktedonospora formicarum]